MRRSSLFALLIVPFVVMLGHATAASAQTPKPEQTHRDVLLHRWTEISDKIVKMAEDFRRNVISGTIWVDQ